MQRGEVPDELVVVPGWSVERFPVGTVHGATVVVLPSGPVRRVDANASSGTLVFVDPLRSFDLTGDAVPGARTVFVSRHARTILNEQRILQGWQNNELSAVGREQALRARSWWDAREVDRVITSPISRALETALHLFGRVDDIDAGWAELAIPGLAGLAAEAAAEMRPDLCDARGWPLLDAPRDRAAEHVDTVADRAVGSLRRAAAAVAPGGTVAVVTHGSVLGSLLRIGECAGAAHNLAVAEITVDPITGWSMRGLHNPLDTI